MIDLDVVVEPVAPGISRLINRYVYLAFLEVPSL